MNTARNWCVAALIIGGGIIQPAAFLVGMRYAPVYGILAGLMVLAIGFAYMLRISTK